MLLFWALTLYAVTSSRLITITGTSLAITAPFRDEDVALAIDNKENEKYVSEYVSVAVFARCLKPAKRATA